MEIPEPLRARMNRPEPPPLERVLSFLRSEVADSVTLEEVFELVRELARINTRTPRRDAEALEAVVAEPPAEPGTLSRMVASEGNWVLVDPTSDEEARQFLNKLAVLVRAAIADVSN